jgi:hypothetical protein
MLRVAKYGFLALVVIVTYQFLPSLGQLGWPTLNREHPRWQTIERHLRGAGAEAARWAEEALEHEE